MTLYNIGGEIQYLRMLAEDPDTDPQLFADTMEALTLELADKAEGYVVVMKELEAQADMFDKEIARLQERKKALTTNASRMKENLKASMMAAGLEKLSTEHFKLSIAKNGGVQPLKLADISKIPQEYIITEPKADTNKIREALAQGAKLDFATLEPRGTRLNIR